MTDSSRVQSSDSSLELAESLPVFFLSLWNFRVGLLLG